MPMLLVSKWKTTNYNLKILYVAINLNGHILQKQYNPFYINEF